MVGILWPAWYQRRLWSILLYDSSVVSILFRRTSEVKFALFERVEVGEGIVDQICCETHCCEEPRRCARGWGVDELLLCRWDDAGVGVEFGIFEARSLAVDGAFDTAMCQ